MSEHISQLKESEKQTESTDDTCYQDRTGGLFLIGLGAFFLLTNFTNMDIGALWPLVFVVPAMLKLWGAGRTYRRQDHLPRHERQEIISALFLLALATMFISPFGWELWPLFIIVAGISALIKA